MTDPLLLIIDEAFALLMAISKLRNAYSRLVNLSTLGLDGSPQARYLVLRDVEADPLQLVFFTDARSNKVNEIRKYPNATALHFNHEKNWQFRFLGRAVLVDDYTIRQTYWETYKVSPKDYASMHPPGSPISDNKPNLLEKDFAFNHFMVIKFKVIQLDLLKIDTLINERYVFQWDSAGNLSASAQVCP